MFGYLKRFLVVLLLLSGGLKFGFVPSASGQIINFGDYIPSDDENYALHVSLLGGYEKLDFGLVMAGQSYDIELTSGQLVILEIEGLRDIEVFVTLTPENLNLNGDEIELTLKGGYANHGEGNFDPAFREPFNGMTARFPLFQRASGPPRPPPVPPHEGYVPPRETAYLFLYGGIIVPEAVQPGMYEGVITVEISYHM